MARLQYLTIFIALQILCLPAFARPAPTLKTLQRFQTQCDEGSGVACYNYGRALWAQGRKKEGLHSLARGCDLKYKLACGTYEDHNTVTQHVRKNSEATGSICFATGELSTARFTSNTTAQGNLGQKIDRIHPGSFWQKAQLQENDVIARLNNMAFNNNQEVLKAFGSSGKSFAFEVIRDGETITVWYTCQ